MPDAGRIFSDQIFAVDKIRAKSPEISQIFRGNIFRPKFRGLQDPSKISRKFPRKSRKYFSAPIFAGIKLRAKFPEISQNISEKYLSAQNFAGIMLRPEKSISSRNFVVNAATRSTHCGMPAERTAGPERREQCTQGTLSTTINYNMFLLPGPHLPALQTFCLNPNADFATHVLPEGDKAVASSHTSLAECSPDPSKRVSHR